MQAIPIPVHNVTVIPHREPPWIGPAELPVIEGASGTYAVGTLGMSVFYNLNLEGGSHDRPLGLGQLYTARAEADSGPPFDTPPMHCLATGDNPSFGLTATLGQPGNPVAVLRADHNTGPYIVLGPLTDINVTYADPPPAVAITELIQGGHGHIIATRTGTPHLMGVAVENGERLGRLQQGMHNVRVSAKDANGNQFWQSGLTVVDGGDPAILLQTWPPRS